MAEIGPTYSVPLIDSLPLNCGADDGRGFRQAMPSRLDLRGVLSCKKTSDRVANGYEVLLNHWHAQQAHIATLEKQLKAQRAVVAADDEYFADPPGHDATITVERVNKRQACRKARAAAKEIDDAA